LSCECCKKTMTKQKNNSSIVPVILCGGSGKRLWPLSRESFPKQFVPIIKGKSLLELAFNRANAISSNGKIYTVASEKHRFLINDISLKANISCLNILEPIAKNTAPAMALAALNASKDDILVFLPSDHHIPDNKAFVQAVHDGIPSAECGSFVTFGITPSHPHTGYGYIRVESPKKMIQKVHSFFEKPNLNDAISFVADGRFFWNSGIFLVKAGTLLDSLLHFAPDILETVERVVKFQRQEDNFIFLDKDIFRNCRSESIDYAVLEKHEEVCLVRYSGVWSDLGNWIAVNELNSKDKEGNSKIGNGKFFDCKSTYIHGAERLVVAAGLENLVIVDTKDALLVLNKDHVEKLKDLVENLKQIGLTEAIEHKYSKRPWGEFNVIDEGYGFKVKRIIVKPGGCLSLQSHKHRAEHWVVVQGIASVTCNSKTFTLSKNESTFIPINVKHRLENPGNIPLEIIEVQSGDYLDEDDIERFQDSYGRENTIN